MILDYLKENMITEVKRIKYIETVEGGIKLLGINSWPDNKLMRINSILKRKGYDVRGPEDVRNMLIKFSSNNNGVVKNAFDDWVLALKQTFPDVENAPPKSDEEKIRSKVARYFGITNNFKLAGYITPDGKMLNFAGKYGSMGNHRELDHREIGAAWENSTHPAMQGGSKGMKEFIKLGYIRIDGKSGAIHIEKDPTDKQINVIYNFIPQVDSDNVTLSLYNGDKNILEEIPKNERNIIIRTIKGFYRGGYNPQSLTQKFHGGNE